MPLSRKESRVTNTWTATYAFKKIKPFTKKQVEGITKKATIRQKVGLLLRPSRYSYDDSKEGVYVVRYKEVDGITFVMKRGTGFRPKHKEQL